MYLSLQLLPHLFSPASSHHAPSSNAPISQTNKMTRTQRYHHTQQALIWPGLVHGTITCSLGHVGPVAGAMGGGVGQQLGVLLRRPRPHLHVRLVAARRPPHRSAGLDDDQPPLASSRALTTMPAGRRRDEITPGEKVILLVRMDGEGGRLPQPR